MVIKVMVRVDISGEKILNIKIIIVKVKKNGWKAHVTYIPLENTLNTKVKQIRNPQKEISGGFFYDKIKQ